MSDVEVRNWNAIRDDTKFSTLVLGNGFSSNISDRFAYNSLKQVADKQMDDAVTALFDHLKTSNFEEVLESLHNTKSIITAIPDIDTDREIQRTIDGLYSEVRQLLLDAVREVHVSSISEGKQILIADELLNYTDVFTLNYDLIVYWAFQRVVQEIKSTSDDPGKPNTIACDYFRPRDGQLAHVPHLYRGEEAAINLYYLHGGLHLSKDRETGSTAKASSKDGKTLIKMLSSIIGNIDDSKIPLFVSEGNSTEKLRAIRKSSYLSFCYSRFKQCPGNVVAFGLEFGDQDLHISKALGTNFERSDEQRKLAISVFSPSRDYSELVERAEQIRARLPRKLKNANSEIVFFDSQTHPLGDKQLSI